jgi:hypothetical protein
MQQPHLSIAMTINTPLQLPHFHLKLLIQPYHQLIKISPFHLVLQLLLEPLYNLYRIIHQHPIACHKAYIVVIIMFCDFLQNRLLELLIFFQYILTDVRGVENVLGDLEQVFVGLGLGVLGHL